MRIERHRGKWVIRFSNGSRASTGLNATPENRPAAERALEDFRRRSAGPVETISDVWKAYMADHGSTTIASDRLVYAWKALEPTFGQLRPEQIDRAVCRSYAERRGTDKPPAGHGTVRKELSALRAALRWHDPQTRAVFELPAPPHPRDRYLTRKEYERLLASAGSDHVRLFIQLALVTGARKEALLSLTWLSVDFKRRLIRLGHVTGGKGRAVVPITDRTLDWLTEAHKRRSTEWVIEWGGDRVKSIKKGFARACERARLDGVTPHVLRHTAAVWMAEAGRPMSEIAQYLGHSDTRTTERVYARYSPDYLRKAAEALDV